MRFPGNHNRPKIISLSIANNRSALVLRLVFMALLSLLFIILSAQNASAQEESDSIFLKNANVVMELDTTDIVHPPKRAGWMSAALPGLGQAYNKKYWKIPIIYAAFGTTTYFLIKNQKDYIKYRDSYIARIDNDPNTVDEFPRLSTDAIRIYKNIYWKNRDLSIIILAAVYTLNILDAVVDAHFYTYDISDDLSLQITPVMTPALNFGSQTSGYAGLSLSLSF